jgi:uncharacterized repeat protein (TIGR02543 family)
MSKKTQKYIVVLFTVLLSAALLTITAFAESGITREEDPSSSSSDSVTSGVDPASQPSEDSASQQVDSSPQNPSSSEDEPTNPDSGEEEEPFISDGTGNVDVPEDNDTIPVKLDYNDGNGIRVVNVEPGTPVQNLPVPSREGYVFDYWTMNGTQVSPTFQIYSEIILTAQWEQELESSSAKPSSYASVDTHQQEIERAASQAEAATSDPDVLSSEDWESILSTESESVSGAGIVSEETSSAASRGGGSSWLFPVGIILIVLSACGIGTFIYLQFFSDSGSHGPGAGGGKNDFDDMEFVDISSYSEPPLGNSEPKRVPRKKSSDNEDTMPIPHQSRGKQRSGNRDLPQTKPATEKKKEFDWDKFLNDDI